MPPTRMTVVHEITRYACGGFTTPNSTIAVAASKPATAGTTTPVASKATMPAITVDRDGCSSAERHALAAHHVRCVDDQHITVGRVLLDRLPRALDDQCVAGGEDGRLRADVIAVALDGQYDQLAARCDHAGERGETGEDGTAARDDHFREAVPHRQLGGVRYVGAGVELERQVGCQTLDVGARPTDDDDVVGVEQVVGTDRIIVVE